MVIYRQSERVILRRMYAFLKSRRLDATAYTLEHEARLKLDLLHVVKIISKGRWRTADKYLSSFFGGKGRSPAACAALFVVRFERMVAALKRGNNAWAEGYYYDKVSPLVDDHPDAVPARADCFRALFHSDAAALRRNHPDDEEYRDRRTDEFLGYFQQCDNVFLCSQDMLDKNLVRIRRTAAIGLRPYAAAARRVGKPDAKFVAELYLLRRKCIETCAYAPFYC